MYVHRQSVAMALLQLQLCRCVTEWKMQYCVNTFQATSAFFKLVFTSFLFPAEGALGFGWQRRGGSTSLMAEIRQNLMSLAITTLQCSLPRSRSRGPGSHPGAVRGMGRLCSTASKTQSWPMAHSMGRGAGRWWTPWALALCPQCVMPLGRSCLHGEGCPGVAAPVAALP